MIKDKILELNLKNRSHKIFGIGFPKTGTNSLNGALRRLGYNAIHHCPAYCKANAANIPISAWSYILNPIGWDSLTNFGEHIYPLLDKEFPNSKFILTVRDKRSWLKSVRKHFDLSPLFDKSNHCIGGRSRLIKVVQTFHYPSYNEDYFSILYDNHFRNVKHYFKDREQDLLTIDICGEEGWEKLCHFLGKDIPNVPFPHKNKTRFKKNAHFKN